MKYIFASIFLSSSTYRLENVLRARGRPIKVNLTVALLLQLIFCFFSIKSSNEVSLRISCKPISKRWSIWTALDNTTSDFCKALLTILILLRISNQIIKEQINLKFWIFSKVKQLNSLIQHLCFRRKKNKKCIINFS